MQLRRKGPSAGKGKIQFAPLGECREMGRFQAPGDMSRLPPPTGSLSVQPRKRAGDLVSRPADIRTPPLSSSQPPRFSFRETA